MSFIDRHDPTLGLEDAVNRLLDFDNVSALDNDPEVASELQSCADGYDNDQSIRPSDSILPSPGLDDADYADFPKFIPNFVKPDKPCDYCATRGLDCHMYFGKITCKACDSLFRPCSFANVKGTNEQNNHRGIIDTLHIVQEDQCVEQGGLTGIKILRSNGAPAGVVFDESKKTSNRFPRAAVKVLREWYDTHSRHPYPTEDEKIWLEHQTGLKASQIATWLANTRRRSKAATTKRAQSPSIPNRTQPVDMSTASQARDWSDLTPYERWQHSPPANDPAPINAIANAVARSEMPRSSRTGSCSGPQTLCSSSELSAKRALSITSTGQESSKSRSRSATSSAVWSYESQSSLGSLKSFGSGAHGKRDRGRKRKMRAIAIRKVDEDRRIYQCTFCCDTFKTKYDWTRHEKSLHLSLEKWICTPSSPNFTDLTTGIETCVYCGQENPSEDHAEEHSHFECNQKSLEHRTFYRKDHLRQHLRLMHRCELLPAMNTWKVSFDSINSRCGFCAERFTSWDVRNAHIANHFKSGIKMNKWSSCRGLDPEIAATVTNAMPAYLIGFESATPNPFSASRGNFHHSQVPMAGASTQDSEGWPYSGTNLLAAMPPTTRATCLEVLSIALGRYVKEQADLGVPVTDQMLVSHSRITMYGSDDPVDHTPAENQEWLDLFKRAYVIDMIPTEVGGAGSCVPSDLELYADVGIRIPFHLQQEHSTRADTDLLQPSESPGSDSLSAEQRAGNIFRAYTAYELEPLPADRVAHFVTPIKNSPPDDAAFAESLDVGRSGTMEAMAGLYSSNAGQANKHGIEFATGLSPEQQAAWDEAVARETEHMTVTETQDPHTSFHTDLATLGLDKQDSVHHDNGISHTQPVGQAVFSPLFDPLEYLDVDMLVEHANDVQSSNQDAQSFEIASPVQPASAPTRHHDAFMTTHDMEFDFDDIAFG